TSHRRNRLLDALPRHFISGPTSTAFYTLSLHDALPIFISVEGSGYRPAGMYAATVSSGRTIWPRWSPGASSPNRSGGICTRAPRSEEHTSELQSRRELVCRLLLEKKNHNSSRTR